MREKCKCYKAYNSYKMHDVEKMFLGGNARGVYILQKMIFGPYQ